MQTLNRTDVKNIEKQPADPAPSAVTVDDQMRQRWRFWFVACMFSLLGAVIVWQIVTYHVVRSDEAAGFPQVPSPPAARGVIVDRDGELLAIDRFNYQVSATPKHIDNDEQRRTIAHQLEALIGVPADDTMQTLLTYSESEFAILAKEISLDAGNALISFQQEQIKENNFLFEEVQVTAMPKRYYPQNKLASQVIGFVRAERFGFYGIEGYYDAFLEADGVGLTDNSTLQISDMPVEARRYLPSLSGKDLMLSIDRTVQWIIQEELARGLDEFKAESGTIIVMEPKTGAILGLANWPTFDPNHYDEVSFDHYANPSISAQYEPGSIFKIVTIAAALDAGLVEPTTILSDTGYIVVGGRPIYNSDRMSHGDVTTTEALAKSLNVITAKIAVDLGPEVFYSYLRRFGFDDATEIDLSGEISGIVKKPGSELWSVADLGTNSFGQGLAVTPIQMINAAAAIANGGNLMRPYVVQARLEDGAVQMTEPTILRKVIEPETARLMAEMMVEVVDVGNKKAAVPGYRVAGKSGTAQIPIVGGYLKDRTIVSFVGFAPADDPQFVLLVKMDKPDPDISQWATHTAAPVFSRVSQRLFDHLNIPPDDVRLNQVAVVQE